MNKDIIKSEVFYDLPEDLQSEVEGMIRWVELRYLLILLLMLLFNGIQNGLFQEK